MAEIRYVRPPNDNKIRNNIEFPPDSNIIHVTTPQMGTVRQKKPCDLKHEPSWKMFITSWSDQVPNQNKEPTSTGTTKSHGEISSDSVQCDQNKNDEAPETTVPPAQAQSSEVQLSHGDLQENNESYSTEESEFPPQSNDYKMDDISSNMRADSVLPQNKEEITNESEGPKGHSKTPVANGSSSVMMETGIHKCYVGYVISSCAGNAESGLVDVRDEETEKLPEVQYKGTSFTAQRHRCAVQEHKPNLENDGNHTENTGNTLLKPRPIQNSQKSPRKLWRSISETSIIRENSFFGSVKTSDAYAPFSSPETDNDEDEIRIDVMTTMKSHTKRVSGHGLLHRSAWELDTLHENGQNDRKTPCDHKHEAKLKCFSLKKNLVSSTPVEDFHSFVDTNNEKNDSKKKEDADCADRCDMSQEFVDRLRMRRGALAEPEKMIMSQDVREKIERDVEKRKTSMARRLSQFFNIQLGLNKEEDLI